MSGGQMLVLLCVLIAVIGGVIKSRHALEINRRRDSDDPDTQRLREEVRVLKERVQVLERVITDNRSSIDLDREISALRDR